MTRPSFICLAAILLITCPAWTQPQQIDFGSDQWTLMNAQVVQHLGRASLKGSARLKDVVFRNGVIDVDVATVAGMRSYPGVTFRIQDPETYERIYIRPHRSILYPDAIQYVASFHGIDSWQLYNGDGRTSSADIPPGEWNHLRIEVAGSMAKVFWNDMNVPALVIPDLAHEVSEGTIGLDGPADGSAFFSNFRYETSGKPVVMTDTEPDSVVGIIREWEISDPFPVTRADFEHYPSGNDLKTLAWKKVQSDSRGLVDISRHFGRTSRAGDCLFARTTIRSDKDSLLFLGFGYSDYITIFADGRPVFFGNSAYQSRDRSFLGIAGYFDRVFVPLHSGENELLVLVGESFGGWGFMFRDEGAVYLSAGVTVAWDAPNSITIPESVVFDEENNVCYVSSYFNDGKECIARISADGEVLDEAWITGLSMPTGMCLSDGKLYVVDRRSLTVVDIRSGAVTDNVPLTGMAFPNDIVTDGNGTFYISDTRGHAIFQYTNGVLEKWLSGRNIASPNGLLLDGESLLVGVGSDASLKRVNLKDKSVETVATLGSQANIDGIKRFDDSRYLVSDYTGRLFMISRTGQTQVLVDSRTPGWTLADFAYIPSAQRLIVPTLFNNRILAFDISFAD